MKTIIMSVLMIPMITFGVIEDHYSIKMNLDIPSEVNGNIRKTYMKGGFIIRWIDEGVPSFYFDDLVSNDSTTYECIVDSVYYRYIGNKPVLLLDIKLKSESNSLSMIISGVRGNSKNIKTGNHRDLVMKQITGSIVGEKYNELGTPIAGSFTIKLIKRISK